MDFLQSTTINFDNLATSLIARDGDLFQNLCKLCKDEELNPEEIKRLVEKVNLKLTLGLLISGTDKKQVLDLIDYPKVLQELHSVPSEKVAEEICQNFPTTNVLAVELSDLFGNTEKTAKDQTEPQTPQHTHAFYLQQLGPINETLDTEIIAIECELDKNIKELFAYFKQSDAMDFQHFTTQALSGLGEAALPILQALSKSLEKPQTNFIPDTTTVVDDTTKPYLILKDAVARILNLEILKSAKDLTVKILQVAKSKIGE